MNFKSVEVNNLIQFGYDLHEKGLDYYAEGCWHVPYYEYNCNHSRMDMKKVENGAVIGRRAYANHSDPTLYTTFGVIIGNHFKNGFEYIKSIIFWSSNNLERGHYIAVLNPDSDKSSLVYSGNEKIPNLIIDCDNDWNSMPEGMKLNLFLDAMETVGFRRTDVIDVLEGRKTAEQAFVAVAPPEIKNRRWVNTHRKHFIFEGNTAVEGSYDSIRLDEFPFPFEGAAILDCSKVKTACVYFGKNQKGHKLINVNSNPKSIIYTDLKNAVIEEPIDLSKVDATSTKIGHHIVKNLYKSIAFLEDINLTFAVDENGNRFEVDENGILKLDKFGKPCLYIFSKVEENSNDDKIANIEVLANADDAITVNEALNNDADGIGLVRTEHMFFNDNDVPLFIRLFAEGKDYEKVLEKCAEIQKMQANNMLKNAKGKKVVFRLLDAKLGEFLTTAQLNIYKSRNAANSRGAQLLLNNPDIIKMQVQAIFDAAIENGAVVNLLVPMITDAYQFFEIKRIIDEIAAEKSFYGYTVGAMIENIDMVNDADILAKGANFISFGTNDLTESVTGLSRDSRAAVFSVLSDEVKSRIKEGIYRARAIKPDIKIGICGDHSSHLENVDFLLRSGVDYISCNTSFISTAKQVFAQEESTFIRKLQK